MSRFMVEHLREQIPALEERFRKAKSRSDWEDGADCLREAARVARMLVDYHKGNPKEAKEYLSKAERWHAKAEELTERKAFPDPPKREAAGGPDEEDDKASDWLLRERPDLSFDDIAGLDDAKEQIRIRMVYPFLQPDLAEKYGVKKGGGVLLYGPPGTGKTMLAKAVASEIDAAFFTVRPSEIMSKWVGESEQNIRRLFQEARENPSSIIFIDEVEALLPPRSEDSPSVMKRLVPQILAELEGIDTDHKNPLLFVGATNAPWNIDTAILRPGRFDEKIYIGLPDEEARAAILRMNLADRPLVDVDFEGLVGATEGFSGADIRNLAQKTANAVFLEAVRSGEERDITMDDFRKTLASVRPSVGADILARFDTFRERGAS
jgi:transitional endoplasmic reticulum ATPase